MSAVCGVPKAGCSCEDSDDAWCPAEGGLLSGERLRIAIADGATEALLSRQWAQLLVRAFCEQTGVSLAVEELLAVAYPAWKTWRQGYLRERHAKNRPIQWFEEPGLAAGAFAAFCGLELSEREHSASGEWSAIAVGDCCFFHVRGDRLVRCFPIQESSEFTNHPALISSNPTGNTLLSKTVSSARGAWEPGDRMLLMSDALAAWFLKEVESGHLPWDELSSLVVQREEGGAIFMAWLDKLRRAHAIRNDDVSLVALYLL